MSLEEMNKALERLKAVADEFHKSLEETDRRILVNKQTHRIRFEGETEDEVTVIIEKRDADRKRGGGKA